MSTLKLQLRNKSIPGVPDGIRITEYVGWQENGVLRKWYEGDVVRNPLDIASLIEHNAQHEVLQ